MSAQGEGGVTLIAYRHPVQHYERMVELRIVQGGGDDVAGSDSRGVDTPINTLRADATVSAQSATQRDTSDDLLEILSLAMDVAAATAHVRKIPLSGMVILASSNGYLGSVVSPDCDDEDVAESVRQCMDIVNEEMLP